MTRLTNSIKPYKIFMGEKDFQQLYLVKKYLKKNFKSKIIPCKTIRDKGNLALSSRNFLLTKLEIKKARKFTQALFSLKKKLSRQTNK